MTEEERECDMREDAEMWKMAFIIADAKARRRGYDPLTRCDDIRVLAKDEYDRLREEHDTAKKVRAKHG